MMLKKIYFAIIFVACLACETTQDGGVVPGNQETSKWLIPIDEVRDGGVGRDGIPSIDNPTYSSVAEQQVVLDDELISGVLINGIPVAFPHKIMDYHEIVNAEHDGFPYALSYCPLTGTSIVYPRNVNGEKTTFGVSGLLFNSNLILYDRSTESLWAQMMWQAVNGPLIEKETPFTQVIETTWEVWKKWYPETLVLDPPNGQPRSYDLYPYGGYRENHDFLLFQPKNDYDAVPRKERILGIVNGGSMEYFRFNQFVNGIQHQRIKIQRDDYLVFGNEVSKYMFAYLAITESGESIEVAKVLDDQVNGRLFRDTNGNVWSVFGEALSGSLKGQKLQQRRNFIGYSFAMAAFYPDDFFNR